MGQEKACAVRFGGSKSAGTAYLESTELIFKGDFRLSIPFKDISSVEARRGTLTVKFPAGVASFDLGRLAEKWALKIRYPRGLLDKLGVKPDSRCSVLGLEDESFLKQLRERTASVSLGKALKDSDLVFFFATRQEELKRLETLRKTIQPAGAVWVIWPKGQKALTEDHVRARGPEAGLVDVKVVSFSETLSALKMMVPRARR